MTTPVIKYVLRLADGSYIYDIEMNVEPTDPKVLSCKSRIRAQQFTLIEAESIKSLITCERIQAHWERIP